MTRKIIFLFHSKASVFHLKDFFKENQRLFVIFVPCKPVSLLFSVFCGCYAELGLECAAEVAWSLETAYCLYFAH